MVVLDATIVNIALPSIKTDLHFSDASLQWVVNSYTLVFGGFLMLGGRAADLLGRRALFVAGIIVFSLASLLNGLAQTEGQLIAFRALQGLGGALVSPAALSIIMTTFAEGEDRTKALGVWSAIAAGGAAFGLLLGGVLTYYFSWPWVFFVNVPVGLLTLLATFRWVPESKVKNAIRHFDALGAITVTAGLMLFVYAIVGVVKHGWTGSSKFDLGLFSFHAPHVALLTVIAIALLGLFVIIEARSKSPLVRLDLFRARSLAVSNLTMFVVAGGMFSMFYFASLYVQFILHYSPLKAGFAFLPVTLGIGIGAGIAQGGIKKFGVKAVGVVGMTVAALGLLVLSLTTKTDGTYLMLLAGLFPMSIGMGLTFVPMTLVATTGVSDDESGAASGGFNTSQQIGGALGLAVLATVQANTTKDFLGKLRHAPSASELGTGLVNGIQDAFVGSVVLMTIGAVMVLLFLRRKDVDIIDSNNSDIDDDFHDIDVDKIDHDPNAVVVPV
ncbi:MAG: MFS transporter [Thermoleophilia bacterium]|nr:MFS transporter [Thermoleophilia bacterium]